MHTARLARTSELIGLLVRTHPTGPAMGIILGWLIASFALSLCRHIDPYSHLPAGITRINMFATSWLCWMDILLIPIWLAMLYNFERGAVHRVEARRLYSGIPEMAEFEHLWNLCE